MHQVNLSDQLFQDAQRRAAEAGFASVDEFVAEVLQHELQNDDANFDHLFTPERLAHIARAAAQIDAGQGIPADQMREHFRQQRSE